MNEVVVDASVMLSRLVFDEYEPVVRGAVARWAIAGRDLLVPDHFWLEVTNSLMRRHHWNGAQTLEALRELDEMGLQTIHLDRPLLLLAVDLLERHRLTSYDAVYLALARATGATLATFDVELRLAAGDILEPDLGDDAGHRLNESPAPYGDERPVTWPLWSGAGSYLGVLRRRALAEHDAPRRR